MQLEFLIGSYDTEALCPETAQALEMRAEMLSRRRCPALWKFTDKIRAAAKRQKQKRWPWVILSIICLALGFFLFIPGLMEPEKLRAPLIAGALAIAVGLCNLFAGTKRRSSRFEKAAKKLLAGKDTLSTAQGIRVYFTDVGMTLFVDDDAETVPYSDFEAVVETPALFLLVYNASALLLQKRDLLGAAPDELRQFLQTRVAAYDAVEQDLP